MFTQLVMLLTIILLLLVSLETFKQSRRTGYTTGKFLAFGLFFVALGIFSYSIRDILTQFEFYQWELTIGKIGILFHILGGALMLRFLTQLFMSPRFKRIFFAASIIYIAVVLVALILSPLVSEKQQAPLEPLHYEIIRHEPSEMSAHFVLIVFIFGPLLLTSIVLYNTIQLEEKVLKIKAWLYGGGFFFLFIPSIICLFISPIYARWGYLLGAFLLYKALRMKI